ncbi:MAG: aromatic amino acid hydroxylase [Flavobacteriales bacterium]
MNDFFDFNNQQVANLPARLRQFVVSQNYSKYTPIDHAVWRYVMRKNIAYLSKVADSSYLKGLEKTGITINRIPNIQEMNDMLSEIGWGCVCVDGFLPPSAFMEFQAFKVLVIAADIRQLEHIEYTPAPDILHEAAGHAPIIADPTYAEYLRLFGEIGSKAISSAKDFELFEAIRHLSIIKEDPTTKESEIIEAEQKIDIIQANMGEPSEMAKIRNLHWWTVEYGLIGSIDNPKIYGAGLLSSIGESESCMKDSVQKVPYSIDAIHKSFDITEPQPQLFVTPSYRFLTQVLEEYAYSMSLRVGGLLGLERAIDSKNTCTAEYSSGLQVSGTFSKVIQKNEQPIYLSTNSATALAWQDKELVGHGKSYHKDGFGSPIGLLKNSDIPIEEMSMDMLKENNIISGNSVVLEFESGVIVKGFLNNIWKNRKGINMLMSFSDCEVTYKNEYLFKPEWGLYDMAIGHSIVSVYAGAADIDVFDKDKVFEFKETTHKITLSESRKNLNNLYSCVQKIRDGEKSSLSLQQIFDELKISHPQDWLCALDILEIAEKEELKKELKTYLLELSKVSEFSTLIVDGINLLP